MMILYTDLLAIRKWKRKNFYKKTKLCYHFTLNMAYCWAQLGLVPKTTKLIMHPTKADGAAENENKQWSNLIFLILQTSDNNSAGACILVHCCTIVDIDHDRHQFILAILHDWLSIDSNSIKELPREDFCLNESKYVVFFMK